MARARQATTEIESRIGYTFKSRPLLEQALTHASTRSGRSGGGDNERLEFIGDRVLGLAIAEYLSELDPAAREGQLARRFNLLVNGRTCARVARSIGLGERLILAPSEVDSGGRDKETILADAMEALLAAVHIEAGFETARRIIRALWSAEVSAMPDIAVDAKSALQEWAQARGLKLPRYVSVGRTGPDHAPRFECEVRIEGVKPARGSGASKRDAEQAAAKEMLGREGVWGHHVEAE